MGAELMQTVVTTTGKMVATITMANLVVARAHVLPLQHIAATREKVIRIQSHQHIEAVRKKVIHIHNHQRTKKVIHHFHTQVELRQSPSLAKRNGFTMLA